MELRAVPRRDFLKLVGGSAAGVLVLGRGGTFTGAGRPLERTVHAEAEAIGRHERPDLTQIARIVGG